MTTTFPSRRHRRPNLVFAVVGIVAAALLATTSGNARAVDNELGAWLIGSASGAIGDADSDWRFFVDAQGRFTDPGSGAAQYLVRPSVGRRLGGGVTGWIGFGRFETESAAGARAHENRYWQQLSWRPRPLWSGSLALRARLEQRFVSNGDDTGLWLRFMARYQQPLGDGGDRIAFVAIEPFFDLRDTDWSGDAGLRQHRVMFGVGWRLAPNWRLETGYMNQYLIRDDRENVSNHLLTLNFRRSF